MKHFCLKYFLYLCIAANFVVSNSSETFLKPEAHESSLHDKVISREPRVFIFKDMKKSMYVEVDGIFYEFYTKAGKAVGCCGGTVKSRCLSDKFPKYKILPSQIVYTEKRCTKCGKIKLLKEFSKDSSKRDGLGYACKECDSKRGKEYDKNNPEKRKKYRQDNKEKISKRRKEYNSRPDIKNKRKVYERKKRKTDIAYKINCNMSRGINHSLMGKKNRAHWEDLVDYDLEGLMVHLESKFTEGMNWDNYGQGKHKWSIDHIIAKCHFDITSNACQKFKDCWALKNLQPLWDTRNKEKGDKPMEPKYLIKPFKT